MIRELQREEKFHSYCGHCWSDRFDINTGQRRSPIIEKRIFISSFDTNLKKLMLLKSRRMEGIVYRILAGIILLILAVQLSIGLITIFKNNESHKVRLIPRYTGKPEFEIPSKYLNGELQDTDAHFSLQAEVANSHFAARRDILDKNSKSRDFLKDYLNIDGEASTFPFQCTTCAVIGNSGYLLNSTLGSIIDQSSCVFRLGLAPVKGYETDVGSKTTARIANSNRLYPFLKKPKKLISGPFASDQWFLFDRRRGDITRLYSRLIPLMKKDKNIGFFWFSRKAEIAAFEALENLGQRLKMKMPGMHPETLWYSIRILEDAGCQSLDMFGIPDPMICRRTENVSIRTIYWEPSSPNQCFGGNDAGNVTKNSKMFPEDTIRLHDRTGLLFWAKQRTHVSFHAPSWTDDVFS